MNVVLSQFEGIDNTPGLPLAIGILAATARRDARLARACRFEMHVVRQDIDAVVDGYHAPDVLGFSLYPWNAAYSLAVARAARLRYPDALIVVGGPSVPRPHDIARRFLAENPWVDVLVFAEGELAFRELLRARLDASPLARVPGIAYRERAAHGQGIHFTAPPTRVLDMSETGSPYLDGTFDALLREHPGRFSMGLIESNRGCPFSCTFCDWSLTKRVVEFPLDRVCAEIDWLAAHGFGHICITDANFGIRPRDHDIARHIAATREATGLPSFCYFYLTKNNHQKNLGTIEILHRAGIGCCVGLAVQDFDDEVLAAVKRDNIQSGESIRLRDICAARGIPTHNELILGLPRQTHDSFARTLVQAMPWYPGHDFVVFLCRLLDNTEMASEAHRREFAIETRRCLWKSSKTRWDPVIDEYQEIVVGTRDMPVPAWRRTYRFAFLASALYNQRLLRLVMHYLTRERGVDLVDYLSYLCARTVAAASAEHGTNDDDDDGDGDGDGDGSVFASMGALVDRYLDSILACGPFVLPHPIVGDALLPVDDAIAVTALTRMDDFLAETRTHTARYLGERELASARDQAVLGELFAVQGLCTPRPGQSREQHLDATHDWWAFMERGGTGARLAARPTRLSFTPPSYALIQDAGQFALTHLACVLAHMSTGELARAEPADVSAARAPRRSLPISPSGTWS